MSFQQQYYPHNSSYSDFLDSQSLTDFKKYIDVVLKRIPGQGTFLDVGCGTGIVVDSLSGSGLRASGIEISESSLALAERKQGIYKLYDGFHIPFESASFDSVGSYNVLEHVDDVIKFLDESLRVVKKDGYLIICTPNFLSITNSYHYRTTGWWNKVRNALLTFKKYLHYIMGYPVAFSKFTPINRPDFRPDDDAVNLTNPIDILSWARQRRLEVVLYEASIIEDSGLKRTLNHIPFIKYFFGSILLVLRKSHEG